MIRIYRQKGFILNQDDKVVNGVLKALDKNKGLCPCYHDEEEPLPEKDLQCPCKEYRENKHCRCNLYVEEGPVVDLHELDSLTNELQEVKQKLAKANAQLKAKEGVNLVY